MLFDVLRREVQDFHDRAILCQQSGNHEQSILNNWSRQKQHAMLQEDRVLPMSDLEKKQQIKSEE